MIPQRLSPGGTGLRDTTLAAVRATRVDFDRTADATGGAAYSAVDPTDLQIVLFDALRQR